MRELKHILVVDDDDVACKSLELMLRRHYDIHCEKYGKMAIAYAKYQKVDLILLDMNMPFLSGLETLEMLRQISDYELIPVVFLTGHINREIKQRCVNLGVKRFLTKPVTMENLIRTLDNILYEKRDRIDFAEQKIEEARDMTQNFVPIAESVLLVGEDKEFLGKMRDYLQGYLPRLVFGKNEALLYLDKFRPAVIYAEDGLASASEFNLVRKMRMQPYAWEIPIVIFSNKDSLVYEPQRYKQEGIDFVLLNPEKEEVLEALKEALS